MSVITLTLTQNWEEEIVEAWYSIVAATKMWILSPNMLLSYADNAKQLYNNTKQSMSQDETDHGSFNPLKRE